MNRFIVASLSLAGLSERFFFVVFLPNVSAPRGALLR